MKLKLPIFALSLKAKKRAGRAREASFRKAEGTGKAQAGRAQTAARKGKSGSVHPFLVTRHNCSL